jgi:glycosyltransferase involved in cell wall biosynthesis
MNRQLVSIIIPSYNSKKYVRETVQSALNQSYSPIEIILVDDGSTDETNVFFSEFEKQGVICIAQENAGASSARNTGLAIAKGDYIQFLDADDVLHPNKIERQVGQMQLENADLSFTAWENFVDDVVASQEFRFKHLNFSAIGTGRDLMYSFGMQNWFVPTVAWLVSRDLIVRAGFWNPYKGGLNDDGEYFSRILFWSNKVSRVNEVLAFYRMTPGVSLSNINTEEKAMSSFKSSKLIHALMLSTNDERLLSYAKRGFYIDYIFTRNKFSKVARMNAREFDKIDAPTFLNEGKTYWLIKLLGLHYGSKVQRILGLLKLK